MPASDNDGIQPFRDFLESVHRAVFADFAGKPDVQVASADEFEAMKQHIIRHYDQVDCRHSFADGASVMDCIPFEQQPAVRNLTGPIAGLPSLAELTEQPAPVEDRAAPGPDEKDAHGNRMSGPEGTVALRRLTLMELTRLRSLDDLFRRTPSVTANAAAPATRLSALGTQAIQNWGATALMSVWRPAAGKSSMSCSLMRCVAGSGDQTQCVEAGWQVAPYLYGDPYPHFYVYWTPDNFKTGGYNSNFVLTSTQWPPGKTLPTGSPQQPYGIALDWLYYATYGWILQVNKIGIGHFPQSLFNNGPLTQGGLSVQFGGEVSNSDATGSEPWPQMGSGAYASQGTGQAASQSSVQYRAKDTYAANPAHLTIRSDSTACYTIAPDQNPKLAPAMFLFGGPGGKSCPIDIVPPTV